MRAPLSWLREFVPIEAEPAALAERLSLSGLTVEEVIRSGEGITGVVVGEVREIREHPNADNLILVRAFDGEIERDIVCGARNFAVRDRVPVALPGARLPGGIEIARRTVRGETSDGMLCSARELRVSDDHSGILVLDADAPLGKDVTAVLDLDDVIFDFDITTNRGDLLSIVGIAREIAALYKLPLTVPSESVPESDEDASALASVTVEDARGCPRYLARIITDVKIGPSPWWIRRRLLVSGMRPISNVVDVTNYVLLERGQPLHAFDLDRLEGRGIVVRRPRKGERITTLDGVERALTRDDVVICDASRPVAIAGVMGGAKTEVSDSTTHILLESAHFDPVRVRTTAARVGLRSEASVRFEKGSDPEAARPAADLAARLFAELAGGRVARGAIDVYPRSAKPKKIKLRTARASMLVGASQETAFVASTLRALGCEVEEARSGVRAIPPTWRPDLLEEVDLIEEVARYYGYEKVPARLPTGARIGGLTLRQRQRRAVRGVLLGAGVTEAQTLSLLPPWLADRIGVPPHHPLRRARRVSNPLSEEESVLRPGLVPGLILAAQRNVARRVLPVRLFELGVVFHPADPVDEHWNLAWLLCGSAPRGWFSEERELDFFDSKGVLEALLEGLGVRDYALDVAEPDHGIHPGRSATVSSRGTMIGTIAELHPRVAEAFELPRRVAVAEIDLDLLLDAADGSRANVPARFPRIERDVALVVPDTTPAAQVEAAIREAVGTLLEHAELFDVYRGDQVPEGSVSLAFALRLRDPERTLTDAEADAAFGRITEVATARAWTIRE